MSRGLVTTFITISMLAHSAHAADRATCRIASVPEMTFSKTPLTIAVEYKLSSEIESSRLHVELKDLSHNVLTSQAREISGEGRESFDFECPDMQDQQLIVAAWIGEDWQEPFCPIQFSDPIPVFPYEAYQQKIVADSATPEQINQRLASLGYIRAPGRNAAILSIDLPEMDRSVIEHYKNAFPSAGFEVVELSLDSTLDAVLFSPKYFDFLLIADIRSFPSNYTSTLMNYLQGGGKLIAFGAPAFKSQVWRSGDRWTTRDSYSAELLKTEPTEVILDFEDGSLEGWRRGALNPQTHTEHEIVEEGKDGGKCLKVGIDELQGWDTYAFSFPEQRTFPENALMIFWARGDSNTRNLVVEWSEKDFSRWIATVELTTEWKKYVLTPSDFGYWRDNPSKGRGEKGDRFHPENARMISFGLAEGFAPYRRGESYAYWVDDVSLAVNPEISPPPDYELHLPTISPEYKIYRLGEISELWNSAPYSDNNGSVKAHVKEAWFPMPRHQGGGFARNGDKRFIPLMDARHSDGTYRGSVCAMLVNLGKPWFPAAWVTVGTAEGEALKSEGVTQGVIEAAERLSEGVFLAEAGVQGYSYYPGEKMEAGARVINISQAACGASVKTTLRGEGGEEYIALSQELLTRPSMEAESGITTAFEVEAPDTPGRECFIETELLMDGRLVDMIEQRFSIIAEPVEEPSEFIKISGGDFYLKGEKWYPYGVNYWPCYIAGDEPYKRFGKYYNPELIERDLEQMVAMGMNMVSIQSTSFDEERDLLDFIQRIYRHGIRVNLFLHGSDPLNFNRQLVEKQIKGWKLDTNPGVFAYDLAWEHKLGNHGSRRRWDDEWAEWIDERYGNMESAEEDWGFPAPRSDGKITNPSDDQLTSDGQWRIMVAAYRRFVDDFLSRKYREAVQAVKEMAPNQLISVRMGYGGTGPCQPGVFPVDLRSVAKHLEFLSPEGWGMNGSHKDVLSGGITTAYSDWASRGKPCFWCEWGMNIWNRAKVEPDSERIEEQGVQYHYFLEMFLRSGANGQAAWWLPGGFRVGENSDFGILSPDASWRPACYAMKEWSDRLKASRERPVPDRWITIDRDSHPGGYWHVYHEHKEEYAKILLEGHLAGIRTGGTGTNSKNTPLISVGNTEYNGSNPPKYLNAEFNRLEIRNAEGEWIPVSHGDVVQIAVGEPVFVRASVGNTGEAEWIASSESGQEGAVYLSSRSGTGVGLGSILADTSYLEDAEVTPFALVDSPDGRMKLDLEMTAYGRAWFGEKIIVTLQAMPRAK